MLLDERAELLARHLTDGSNVEDELALLARQPAEKQRVVEDRLHIIDQYLAGKTQSTAEADAAAERMGIERRRFYRLLAKLRELGPVRALSPGFRNVDRSAPTKDGLAEPIEEAIRLFLSKHPDAKMTQIEEFARARCKGEDPKYPGDSAIRRRVHALRRAGMIPLKHGAFGTRLVADQVALDLNVEWGGKATLSVITLVIDRDTRLICGFGLTAADGIGLGLGSAISNSGKRLKGFKDQRFSVADHIAELIWVVPPDLEYTADLLSPDILEVAKRRPTIETIAAGPRRHGDAILRLLGDRLGPYPFRRLAELGQDPPRSEGRGIDLNDANVLVSNSVDQWNARLSASAAFPEAQHSEVTRARRLDRLADDLSVLFAPVFTAVAAKQETARRHELQLRGDWHGQ